MIRIVKHLKARLTDAAGFQELPMVPASGTLRTDSEYNDAGLTVKNQLSARLHSSASALHDILHGDLILMLQFEDDSVYYVGTKDIPVRLKVSEGDTLDISAEHVTGGR